ncbi:3'(2'),5'-bisphosphate nucleotidase CysQ [soil metagenome]
MSDLQLLIDAAREAGALMLARRGKVAMRRKPDGSPVTDADLAVNALLLERLRGARPDYGWLSEETGDDSARLSARRVFVVDPIDGTTAYIKAMPWFAVSIAVVEDGRAVAGAVFAPELDEFYAAEAGGGATLNGSPIRAAATEALEGAAFLASSAHPAHPVWRESNVSKCNALALRMAKVAGGSSDAAVSLYPNNEWDLAAGAVICAEAGAAVCDPFGRALRCNKPKAKTPGRIAGAPKLLPLILERAAAIAPS